MITDLSEARVTQADREAWERYGPAIFYEDMTGPQVLAEVRQSATAPLLDVIEALQNGIAEYDAVVKVCPANKTFLGEKLCPKCKAGPDEGCREEIRASFTFISNARARLTAALAAHRGGA